MTRGAPTLAETLRRLAHLAQIRGSADEVSDLARAHAAVEALAPAAVAGLLRRARHGSISRDTGIAPALHGRLKEIAVRGPDASIRAAAAALPALLRRLLEGTLPGHRHPSRYRGGNHGRRRAGLP